MPAVAGAPDLTTARLRLRAHRIADFEASLAMWSDPRVTRFIGGRPSTPEETWSRLLRYAGLWALLGYGYWCVCERDTGRFVGEVGLADFGRVIEPPLRGAPEMGWALVPEAQGRGYAREAIAAVLAWSDTHLHALRTVCMIDPDNTPSIRVAHDCGFEAYAHAVYKDTPTVLYQRTRREG